MNSTLFVFFPLVENELSIYGVSTTLNFCPMIGNVVLKSLGLYLHGTSINGCHLLLTFISICNVL